MPLVAALRFGPVWRENRRQNRRGTRPPSKSAKTSTQWPRGRNKNEAMSHSMKKWQIILTTAFFLAGRFLPAQQVAPANSPYLVTGAQPVVVGPPYAQGQPMIQPSGQPAVVYPP